MGRGPNHDGNPQKQDIFGLGLWNLEFSQDDSTYFHSLSPESVAYTGGPDGEGEQSKNQARWIRHP